MSTVDTTELSDRQQQRAEIKTALTALRLKKVRIDAIDRELAQIEAQADEAAAEHLKRCEPIQAGLAALEASDHQSDPGRDVVTRKKLQAQLEAANASLGEAISQLRRQIDALRHEREQLRRVLTDLATLENRLTTAPLADQDLLDAFHVQCSREVWARKRASEAEPTLKAANQVLAWPSDFAARSNHMAPATARLAKLDLNDARGLMEEAIAEKARLRELLIAE